MNFHNASTQGIEYDLRHILKDTIVDAKPNDAVTFVDNHECVCASYASSTVIERLTFFLLSARWAVLDWHSDTLTTDLSFRSRARACRAGSEISLFVSLASEFCWFRWLAASNFKPMLSYFYADMVIRESKSFTSELVENVNLLAAYFMGIYIQTSSVMMKSSGVDWNCWLKLGKSLRMDKLEIISPQRTASASSERVTWLTMVVPWSLAIWTSKHHRVLCVSSLAYYQPLDMKAMFTHFEWTSEL